MSCQNCGCDPEANHLCETHTKWPDWGKKVSDTTTQVATGSPTSIRLFETGATRDIDHDKYEIAWAAGFFDGEGSVHTNHGEGKPRKDGSSRVYARLTVGNTNKELLLRLRAAVGNKGSISGPYLRQGGRTKPIWQWTASHAAARHVADLLLPLVSSEKGDKIRGLYKSF